MPWITAWEGASRGAGDSGDFAAVHAPNRPAAFRHPMDGHQSKLPRQPRTTAFACTELFVAKGLGQRLGFRTYGGSPSCCALPSAAIRASPHACRLGALT